MTENKTIVKQTTADQAVAEFLTERSPRQIKKLPATTYPEWDGEYVPGSDWGLEWEAAGENK